MSIRAKKSLGQHFLRSKTALREMIEAAALTTGELVLEIGPGEGVLTQELLNEGAVVIAVETDQRCISLLQERFHEAIEAKQLTLVEGDIRNEITIVELFKKALLGNRSYKLVANIPYYITGMLFRLFLERLRQPSIIVFLVQKEVAEEIIARDGKEGILSLSVKAYGTPRYISKVKKEAFSPPPKVDSAILAITNISRVQVPRTLESKYFSIVKAGLGSRRKMLFGNLTRAFPEMKEELEEIFTTLTIDKSIRGEDLSFENWIRLVKNVPDITVK